MAHKGFGGALCDRSSVSGNRLNAVTSTVASHSVTRRDIWETSVGRSFSLMFNVNERISQDSRKQDERFCDETSRAKSYKRIGYAWINIIRAKHNKKTHQRRSLGRGWGVWPVQWGVSIAVRDANRQNGSCSRTSCLCMGRKYGLQTVNLPGWLVALSTT